MNTCRFCSKWSNSDDLVKYSTRHYAHRDCYLDAGKRLEDLHEWQIRLFPYRIIKERNLMATAMKLAPPR